MKIQELSKFEHKGCQVTIRQLEQVFEYLIVYKGRLYNRNFHIPPKIWNWWRKEKYTKADLEHIGMLLTKNAVDSVELLTMPQDRKGNKSKKKVLEEARHKTKLIQGIK